MKKIFMFAIVFSFAFLGTATASGRNVCVLLVIGNGAYTSAVQRSCDGADLQYVDRKKNMFLEELSYQLNEFYKDGMRLINCQFNANAGQTEYVCVVAR